jgi:hypothetical protein
MLDSVDVQLQLHELSTSLSNNKSTQFSLTMIPIVSHLCEPPCHTAPQVLRGRTSIAESVGTEAGRV